MKTFYYLKRAISMPPHILARKIFRRLKTSIEAKKAKLIDQKFPTYHIHHLIPKRIRTFIEPIDVSLLHKTEILNLCKCYLNHEFDLLGSGWVRVFQGMECVGLERIKYPRSGEFQINERNRSYSEEVRKFISKHYKPIDWHIDFKSGFRWREDSWSKDIEYGTQIGADVKVPWELARMQHLPMLGWGYAIERDQKYVIEFQDQILDFIASNPPRYGVNWVCTMDVGIRIANWLFAYDLFSAFDARFYKDFEKTFSQSIYEHGKHIRTHLEWDPYLRSNHYLANIAGLLFVAIYIEHREWLEFSIRELQSEVFSQFHSDGSNFEASTSYHRLSAEMVLYATALAMEIGVEFGKEYLSLIQKMANFTRDITKPDGKIVQFGDNDSGRFLKLFPDINELDHRYLIRAIRRLKGLNEVIQGQLESIEENGPFESSYPDFGVYLYKNDPWFLAIRCGSIGQKGNGGHAHNDQLSFELSVRGVSMIIDPGTYVYTPLPKARRQFRSTAFHNTLAVDGIEQNRDEGLFRMVDNAQAKVIHIDEKTFCGQHSGFDSVHRREIQVHGSIIEGKDECSLQSKRVHFHFSPDWFIKLISPRECVCTHQSLIVKIEGNGLMEILEGEYSKGYGKKETCPVLAIKIENQTLSWRVKV